MDKNEIRAIVAAEKRAAIGSSTTSDLTRQRSDALDYYLGDMAAHMPSLEGQSKASSSDVSDVIESVLPSLMDIFTSGDEFVEFTPFGPEDEEAAKQETDYVNHVFMQQNPGFMVLYSWMKDGLLSKNGIIKCWWHEYEESEKETYRGLDDAGYSAIAADTSLEIVQQTISETGIDVVVKKGGKSGCVKVVPVPPEEFGISPQAKSIPESGYCYHKLRKTASELIAEGYSKEEVDKLPASTTRNNEDDQEGIARDTFANESDPTTIINRSMRLIDVTEHYIRLDADGDGVAEILKVVTAGDTEMLLGEPEEIDRMPFHSITPVPMTHRFFGRSLADLTIEVQRIKTHLLRQLLDNAALLNNQRIAVGSAGADENTLDDLLTNRPGGIVRMKDITQIREMPNQPLGAYVMPMLEYVDQLRETRTGVGRHVQGLDPNSLNKASQTATGFTGLMEHSMMRIKLIARIFAETGVKSLFLHIHELVQKYQDKASVVRLRNKWVPVDPRTWKTRKDMTVTVALGTGSKDQQIMLLNNILERQIQAIQFQGGVDGPLVSLDNVYNTLRRMVEMTGLKAPELYFTEPDPNAPPREPPPDPKMIEIQQKGQIEQARLQITAQSDQQRMQLDSQKSAADIQLRETEAALKLELMREEAAAKIELEREKALAEQALAERQQAFEMQMAEKQFELQSQQAERQMQMNEHMAERKAANADRETEVRISKKRPGGDLDK